MNHRIFPSIWVTIDKIRHTLGWSNVELCDRMNISDQKLHREKILNLSPSLDSITHFTESIGIDIDAIVTGKIDYRALAAHNSGNLKVLPERYSRAKFSKIRTSIHILDYVEKILGWNAKKTIYNHFQINESMFDNPESTVNFLMPSDICRFIGEKFKASHLQLQRIGAHSSTVNQNSVVGQVAARFNNPKVLYENFFQVMVHQLYEKNQRYRILKLSDDYCIVETNFRSEVKELLKTHQLGNVFACASIAGSMASIPGYLNLAHSKVTKIDCVHHGGCNCKYFIDFSRAKAQLDLAEYRQSCALH